MDRQTQANALRARQQRWMQERHTELERENVIAEIRHESAQDGKPASALTSHCSRGAPAPVASSIGAAQWGAVRPEDVIDKLTQRLADKLRSELRLEMQV